MILTKSQNRVVSKLFNKYLERKECNFSSFKAPTGSGKTFMASELISRIFSEEYGKNIAKTVVVFATVSNAELPKQLSLKLEKYKKYHQFNNYTIEYIFSPSSSKSNKSEDIKEFILEDNKVFVFGTSSFGKNTLFYQNKTLENFIQEAKNQNYEIIFIRDEAHIGSKKELGKDLLKNFDEKVKNAASFIIEMTATPKKDKNFVELTMKEINQDDVFLLKTKQEYQNLFESNEIENEDLIDHAIATFIKSKKEYEKIDNIIIQPAMLIQIMNDADYEKDFLKNKYFKEGLELLEKKLNQNGLKYLKYLNSKPEVFNTNVPATLEYASQLDSHIDVIIFKVGPATGWDIPRANMLLQLRNVSSESLNTQTVGRIMRNPIPSLEKNEITNKYYLYSNYQKPSRDLATYNLKNEFLEKKLYFGEVNQESKIFIENNESYRNSIIDYIKSSDFLNIIEDLNDDAIIYNSLNYGAVVQINKIINYVDLKIFNIKKSFELEKEFKISLFNKYLEEISNNTNKNIEKIKYAFYTLCIKKIKDIMKEKTNWIHSKDPYIIKENGKLLSNYSIWIDNDEKEQKKFSSEKFKNYGYSLINEKKNKNNIQYLDSKPELEFFKKFMQDLPQDKKNEIKFFAKMPTLGSGIYFEYYSEKDSSIKKSYMDVAIEYKNKIIMVEIKSKENDYDYDKTDNLVASYEMYMKNCSKTNLNLVLYRYHETNSQLSLMIDGKWDKKSSFNKAINSLLD